LFTFVVIASIRMGRNPFLLAMVIGLLGILGLRIAAIFDAVSTIRRHPGPRAPIGMTVLAAAIVFVISEANSRALKHFVLESVKLPSGSMVPTLFVGDHVFVDKLRSPERGDLLFFPFPEHPEQDFLKRVVGMPGDRLEFRSGHPIINGVAIPSCYVGRVAYEDGDSSVTKHEGRMYLEILGRHAHLAFYDDAVYGTDYQGPYVVEPGELFILGDNRWNSHDSRMWRNGQGGGVPRSTVKGLPFMVWLAVSQRGVDWSRTGLDLTSPHLPSSMAQLQPALDACLAKSLAPGREN
jgi:signal peptidase I